MSCLQGAQLDVRVHTLLVITILCTFVVIVGETCRPNSFLLAAARPMLIIMQGIWLVQVAHILYRGGHRSGCCIELGSALVLCTTGPGLHLGQSWEEKRQHSCAHRLGAGPSSCKACATFW